MVGGMTTTRRSPPSDPVDLALRAALAYARARAALAAAEAAHDAADLASLAAADVRSAAMRAVASASPTEGVRDE